MEEENNFNIQYHGIDQDNDYIYLAPYGNYDVNNLNENKVTRVLKDNFVISSIENLTLTSSIPCQGKFTGVTIDKTNSYGYLSPYENTVNGIDTDLGVVVRFSTNNYVSNSTNIRAVDLSNNSSGVYLVELRNKYGTIYNKIVLE